MTKKSNNNDEPREYLPASRADEMHGGPDQVGSVLRGGGAAEAVPAAATDPSTMPRPASGMHHLRSM